MEVINKARALLADVRQLKAEHHDLRLLIGATLARQTDGVTSLRDAEFRVFSQFGDDGVIQYLIRRVRPAVDAFVEFGIENYTESNTRFLLLHNNWRGLVMDGSKEHIRYVQQEMFYWRHDLTAVSAFITAENINNLLTDNGFAGRIGLLSVDIDGNDYWVWKALTVAQPDIVIAEYNSQFGPERAITVPYSADFYRLNAHYSGLYFGASLAALYELGQQKGYELIYCNAAGNNAYFVRQECLNGLTPLTPAEAYVQARFREARRPDGTLSMASFAERTEVIRGLPVYNVVTGQSETL